MANHITHGAAPVAPGNQGPLVDVLVWFLLVLIVLSVLMRMVIRRFLGGLRWKEDITICIAAVFGIAQAIATTTEVAYGLGKYQHTLSATEISRVFKAQYAGDLLFLPTLCSAQIGTMQLIEWLAAWKGHKLFARYMTYFTLAWAVPSTIIIAFHGGLPRPWDIQDDTTVNLYLFWIIISILAILTEAALVALPLIIIMPMQLNMSKKLVAASAFCFRVLVLAALATRIAYLSALKPSVTDATYALAPLAVATQFVLALAINTACIPSLKPFLDAFETGLLEVSLYFRNGVDGSSGRTSRGPNNLSGNNFEMNSWNKSGNHNQVSSTAVHAARGQVRDGVYSQGKGLGVGSGRLGREKMAGYGRSDRDRSRESMRSDEMGIVKTAAWEVRYEDSTMMDGGREVGSNSSEPDRSV